MTNAKTSQGLKNNGTTQYMAPELLTHCMIDPYSEESAIPPTTKTRKTDGEYIVA